MTAAVTGHGRRMVRLVSVETAAKKECFQFSAEGQLGRRVTDRRWKFTPCSCRGHLERAVAESGPPSGGNDQRRRNGGPQMTSAFRAGSSTKAVGKTDNEYENLKDFYQVSMYSSIS